MEDPQLFFRMDAQGGECTSDSCVRGCTLTIVAYRRIDESRAMRITESRGIPSLHPYPRGGTQPSGCTKSVNQVLKILVIGQPSLTKYPYLSNPENGVIF